MKVGHNEEINRVIRVKQAMILSLSNIIFRRLFRSQHNRLVQRLAKDRSSRRGSPASRGAGHGPERATAMRSWA